MKERPILFSGPMVRALLAGTKTQTRRFANKPVKHPDLGNLYTPGALVLENEPQHVIERACPYGRPGDRLWVRETWNWFDPAEIPADRRGMRAPFTGCQGPRTIEWVAGYQADGPLNHPSDGAKCLWRPSIHMPRWACRILLEIVSVRIERLNEINRGDAMAEGCPFQNMVQGDDPRAWYADLWEEINGAGSWSANPWVWVVEFKRVEA